MSGLGWLVLALNLWISWHNAKVIGLDWVESRYLGGWTRFMCWMGWLQSALGFTWCYVLILALFAHSAEYINTATEQAAVNLGYVIIFPGLFISGTFIWIDSLVQAWRRRDLPSIATASWNTFAEIHNAYSAIDGMGDALKSVGSLFSDSDEDDVTGVAVVAVIAIVLAALAGGFLTTELIRRHYAGSRPLPERAVPAPA
ncbi:MAG TPA: hypothetical protein VN900_06385 [Stellaceae bacterium]|nr:hypothetical protein [Stellaceae bacterium]